MDDNALNAAIGAKGHLRAAICASEFSLYEPVKGSSEATHARIANESLPLEMLRC